MLYHYATVIPFLNLKAEILTELPTNELPHKKTNNMHRQKQWFSTFVFPTWIKQILSFLNPKFQATVFSAPVQPGLCNTWSKTQTVFSCKGPNTLMPSNVLKDSAQG